MLPHNHRSARQGPRLHDGQHGETLCPSLRPVQEVREPPAPARTLGRLRHTVRIHGARRGLASAAAVHPASDRL